ncbi:MAG TPA: hypothetical protein VGM97_14505 [Steroidobacteraceae bacterium]
MRRVRGEWIGLMVAVTCGLLAGCGHSPDRSAAPLVKRHAAGTAAGSGAMAAQGIDPGPADLVAAVSGGGGEGPVGLKFQVTQRPVSGVPVVINLRLLANQPLEHLEARFHPDDGLQVTQGGDFDPAGPMEAGSAVDHTLTVLPAHDGIYTVMATVTTGSPAQVVSRSFVIPIVVAGQPPAATPAAPVPTVTAKRK